MWRSLLVTTLTILSLIWIENTTSAQSVVSSNGSKVATGKTPNTRRAESKKKFDLEVEVRIVWGGNSPMDYVGEIEFVNAQAESLGQLGIDPLDTGRLTQDEGKFLIDDRNTQFGGCDLRIRGDLVSQLVLRLRTSPPRADGSSSGPVAMLEDWGNADVIRVPLSDLLNGAIERKVGDGSRVVLDRAPGDRFLIHASESQDWILEPGESLSIDIQPNATPWRSQSAQMEWNLIRVSDGTKLLQQSQVIELDDYGTGAPLSIAIPSMPREEGSYELLCQLEPKRLLPGIVFPLPSIHRRIQFVVQASSGGRSNEESGEDVATIQWTKLRTSSDNRDGLSTKESRWASWTSSLPKLRSSPLERIQPEESLDLKPLETIRVPVEIPRLAEGYRIRAAIQQPFRGIAVRILESSSNRAQEIDQEIARYHWKPSSIDIANQYLRSTQSDPSNPQSVSSLQMRDSSIRDGYFFPAQRTVWLEMHNPSEDTPLSIPRIEVVRTRPQVSNHRATRTPQVIECLTSEDWRRLLYRGRKLKSGQLYDSWDSMQASVDAWLVSCKRRGVDTVSIPVLSQGSTLYPTEKIASIPRMETGRFDAEGSDPLPKDVVQWLYHLCQRHGMHFIPTFELDMPLESFFDPANITEKEWQHSDSTSSARNARWNPLQVSVQQSLTSLFLEFEHRYQSAPGYIGYAIRIDTKSSLHIHGSIETLSETIVERLAGHLQGNLPKDLQQRRQAMNKLASGSFDAWQRQQVYDLLENMHRDIYCVFYPKSFSLHGLKVGSIPVLSVLPDSKSIARELSGRLWTDGIAQVAIETKLDRFGLGEWNGISNHLSHMPWSNGLEPVARTDRQRSIDRVRVWQESIAGKTSRSVMLNAGPTDLRVYLRWNEPPGNTQIEQNELLKTDWQLDASESVASITIPPYSLRAIRWENTRARVLTWSSDENSSTPWIESALGTIEHNVTRLSQPRINDSLLVNPDFEQGKENASASSIFGWNASINPNAPVRISNATSLSGDQSLVLSFQSKDAAAWIQSNPFNLLGDRLQTSIHYSTSNACRGFLSLWVWNASMDRFEMIAKRECYPGKSDPKNSGWQRWDFDFSSELQNPNRAFRGEQYRLQLELSGEGEVYLDRFELSTDYLSDKERLELRNSLFVARRSLSEGIGDPALRLIESTWGGLAIALQNDAAGTLPSAKPIKVQRESGPHAAPVGGSPHPKEGPTKLPGDDKPMPERGANRKWRGFWNR